MVVLSEKQINKILFELYKDPRKSFTQLEKDTGIGRATIKKIIDNFTKNNVIWGYSPVLDVNKLGRTVYMILIKVKPSVYKKIKELFKLTYEDNNTPESEILFINSGYTMGKYDFYIKVVAKDILIVKNFVNKLFSNYGDHIDYYEILTELIPVRTCGKVNPELNSYVDRIIK